MSVGLSVIVGDKKKIESKEKSDKIVKNTARINSRGLKMLNIMFFLFFLGVNACT